MLTIQDAVNQIKAQIENAILTGGVQAKNNLIHSQGPICLLHDAVKAAFINEGVNAGFIAPNYGAHAGEMKLSGLLKSKDQDICIQPNNHFPQPEIINTEGILKGTTDPYGKIFTEHILSVNVRSQLSSIVKNFDTLYERTFAESLNLHLRCPEMVLGEVYLIPVYEYDDQLAKTNQIGFKPNNDISRHIEKYISAFNAVNGRNTIAGAEYKYERVCLLIVDFSKPVPKIYNTDAELRADNLLPANSAASLRDLDFPNFAKDMLRIYEHRFGAGRFT